MQTCILLASDNACIHAFRLPSLLPRTLAYSVSITRRCCYCLTCKKPRPTSTRFRCHNHTLCLRSISCTPL